MKLEEMSFRTDAAHINPERAHIISVPESDYKVVVDHIVHIMGRKNDDIYICMLLVNRDSVYKRYITDIHRDNLLFDVPVPDYGFVSK